MQSDTTCYKMQLLGRHAGYMAATLRVLRTALTCLIKPFDNNDTETNKPPKCTTQHYCTKFNVGMFAICRVFFLLSAFRLPTRCGACVEDAKRRIRTEYIYYLALALYIDRMILARIGKSTSSSSIGMAEPDCPPTASSGDQFGSFFQHFLAEQSRDLTDLRAAATAHPQPSVLDLQELVERVVLHYENYYRAKAECAQHDVNLMFSPTWTSSTEDMFMWAGGWRPTAAFHLLYSKSGLQLEAQLEEILQGLLTTDLGNLSAVQLEAVDDLHRSTIKRERSITEKWAVAQEAVAAKEMVEVATGAREGMEGEMEGKRKSALSVLRRADQLRIDTIKGIVGILGCNQAVHFLIAAAELHLAVHEYGKEKDDATVTKQAQTATSVE